MKAETKQAIKANLKKIGRKFYDLLGLVVTNMILGVLWVDRYVWKRYFQIEMPLYKLWWKEHAKTIQRSLNREQWKHANGLAKPYNPLNMALS